jgi:hypothetical protein
MSKDLLKIYKGISGDENGANIKGKIEEELYEKMREHFLELINIGAVLGYDKLQEEMIQATQLIERLKKA